MGSLFYVVLSYVWQKQKETGDKMIKTLCLLALAAVSLPGLEARIHARELADRKNNLETRQSFNCNQGCSLRQAVVCGNDGSTYRNECLAVCQVSFL